MAEIQPTSYLIVITFLTFFIIHAKTFNASVFYVLHTIKI